jgi:hypothetical protein
MRRSRWRTFPDLSEGEVLAFASLAADTFLETAAGVPDEGQRAWLLTVLAEVARQAGRSL